MTTRATEPKQDRSRQTRQRILEATVESLRLRGWEGTTMAAVVKRVDSVSQSVTSLPIPKGIDPLRARAPRPGRRAPAPAPARPPDSSPPSWGWG